MKLNKADAHPKNELNYDYITDGIYIGTNQCCRTHFDELLKTKEGITADISLEEKHIDMPFGVDFYSWLPVVDHTAPSPDQLELGVSILQKLVMLKHKVYIHCKNGHGRAPTLVAAYLIRKGLNLEEATALIKKQRPAAHLWYTQVNALNEFATELALLNPR
jgi:hypothetical protein